MHKQSKVFLYQYCTLSVLVAQILQLLSKKTRKNLPLTSAWKEDPSHFRIYTREKTNARENTWFSPCDKSQKTLRRTWQCHPVTTVDLQKVLCSTAPGSAHTVHTWGSFMSYYYKTSQKPLTLHELLSPSGTKINASLTVNINYQFARAASHKNLDCYSSNS